MKDRSKLFRTRCTAAEILALAVSEHDPTAFGIKGGETPWGFYFDFIFIYPFSKEALPYIEEKMWKLVADNLEVKIHEMLPENGAEFLRYNKQLYPAYFAQTSHDPIIKVAQIGTFVDHVEGSFLEKTGDVKAFKLLWFEQRPDLYFKGSKKSVYRILGVADESKEALKSFIKKRKSSIGVSHLEIGEKLGLFQVELGRGEDYRERAKVYWKRKGEALLHQVYLLWREEHLKEGFELVATRKSQVTKAHQRLYQLSKKTCEEKPVYFAEFQFPILDGGFSPMYGLLGAETCHTDHAHIFCKEKDLMRALHSSLKFLSKIPKMLEIAHSIEVRCPDELIEPLKELSLKTKIQPGKEARIELKLYDGFRRSWKGPFLTLQNEGKIFMIKRSFFSSVERLIALVLEAQEKDLSQKKELLDRMAP